MADDNKSRHMRNTTLTVLLGIFIGAVILAIVSRLLPGRLSGWLRSAKGPKN